MSELTILDTYEVQTETDKKTGIVIDEQWTKPNDELLHRLGGPAKIENCPTTGERTLEVWMVNGLEHRAPGFPSRTVWREGTHELFLMQYCINGKLHRDGDEPAFVRYPPKSIETDYYNEGVLHRDGGPASVKVNQETDVKMHESWWHTGERHRVGDEPALIERDPHSKVIVREEYWQLGMLHRMRNPAVIKRDPNTGSVISEEYFRNDVKVDISTLSDPHPE